MSTTPSLSPVGEAQYEAEKARYLRMLDCANVQNRSGRDEELRTTPLLSLKVKSIATANKKFATPPLFPQYGLLGFNIGKTAHIDHLEPIFSNVDAPNSIFICGQQGSGKSYTLACLLENCLKTCDTGQVTRPVAGVVFHYDQGSPSPAEAASLCARGIRTRVLVSASNFHKMHAAYVALPGAEKHLSVEVLKFQDRHLSIARMHKLMAFSDKEGSVPLYMEVIQRLLREMAIADQPFRFSTFQQKINDIHFDRAQSTMMNMRLDLLKSFCATSSKKAANDMDGPLHLEPGTLTIVDLSDPFVDKSTVCALFEVCLGLFKENRPTSGLVVTLDEAHKYLNKTPAAEMFTDSLLTTIREQRHNATRVIIATQEPTISDKLLDLCSVSVVHHFKSPIWFRTIKDHLGGASTLINGADGQEDVFKSILALETGESLVFSPSSFLCVADGKPQKIGVGIVKMKTRPRQGGDVGMSVLASSGLG